MCCVQWCMPVGFVMLHQHEAQVSFMWWSKTRQDKGITMTYSTDMLSDRVDSGTVQKS